jgi:hypothetical protein
MSVAYGRGDKGKATKLHSKITRSLGYCEACGYQCDCMDKWHHTTGCKLQAAHIEGRTASGTRTQLRNAFCLDASCHRKFTDKPLTFSRFVTNTWAQEHREDLLVLSRPMMGLKMDWTAELSRLKDIEQQIKENKLTLQQARDMEE